METLLQDVRYGFRMLVKSPAFAAVTVITLALGIGANTAIFSMVNSVLLRPLPFDQPERVMLVAETWQGQNGSAGQFFASAAGGKGRSHGSAQVRVARDAWLAAQFPEEKK
jgi:hypothetical protein